MQSPVYSDTVMELKELEPGLSAYLCPKSEGVWIPLQSYVTWNEHHKQVGSPLPAKYFPVPADDSKRPALVCPESGRLLIRYKVGHGLKFHIDLSPVTGGVWLDKGEWEALKSKGLHIELNLVFTAAYQRHVRSAEYEKALYQTFAERIGRDDFSKISTFKHWLTQHPKRRDICCYLLDNLEKTDE